MPDGKAIVGLSDTSGEVEFWTLPANGVGAPSQLTTGGDVLRWDGVPSPDGKRLAHTDKNQRLWVLDLTTKKDTKIAENQIGDFDDLAWSPDSRLLAYTAPSDDQLTRVFLWEASSGPDPGRDHRPLRQLQPGLERRRATGSISCRTGTSRSLVGAPWGSRQPEPFFDHAGTGLPGGDGAGLALAVPAGRRAEHEEYKGHRGRQHEGQEGHKGRQHEGREGHEGRREGRREQATQSRLSTSTASRRA